LPGRSLRAAKGGEAISPLPPDCPPLCLRSPSVAGGRGLDCPTALRVACCMPLCHRADMPYPAGMAADGVERCRQVAQRSSPQRPLRRAVRVLAPSPLLSAPSPRPGGGLSSRRIATALCLPALQHTRVCRSESKRDCPCCRILASCVHAGLWYDLGAQAALPPAPASSPKCARCPCSHGRAPGPPIALRSTGAEHEETDEKERPPPLDP